MKKKTIKRLNYVLLGIIILVGIGLWMRRDPAEKLLGNVPMDVFVVQTEKVQLRDLKRQLLMSGNVKALEEATLYPRVSGKLLKNVLKEGDAVKRNQTVSLIERDEVGAVYEPVVVPSTITGVVGRVYLDPGENVTTTTPVALVVNQSTVRIEVDVPERYIGDLHKGQSAVLRVDALPGKDFEAKLNILSPVVDSMSRAMAVEFVAENPKALLKSGMFAKVDIALAEKKDAPSVSKKSVYTDEQGQTYVYIPSSDKKQAIRQNVKVGFENNDYVEITDGLSTGEEVLAFAYGVKDGSKIEIK
ncbi:efflux RND transporter periplasmic adaptor subunit [Candidatus Avelusimicrobium gallicola]|uniref:Uncharacterized protein n=1 Tax=Candidatus Avelusimicrobium gallicola TaxID=2562704 RepID=A0A1Y4DJ57_9BACT|nr:efflux RND transporter periplasmic adaptor subunit [Elusimicrobium sp. An273]OUO57699.1 hypothetical protein B5F75_02685 [Elusimicrobium sp. An273]